MFHKSETHETRSFSNVAAKRIYFCYDASPVSSSIAPKNASSGWLCFEYEDSTTSVHLKEQDVLKLKECASDLEKSSHEEMSRRWNGKR